MKLRIMENIHYGNDWFVTVKIDSKKNTKWRMYYKYDKDSKINSIILCEGSIKTNIYDSITGKIGYEHLKNNDLID